MSHHMQLSVMSNQMLAAFPQGDPFSGAPYGDRHKSKGLGMILGVVASIATMGAAMPLLAGTTMASQIAGGAMMAGGVLSGVGAITGNKKLAKIGGVLSLAGGIGGWAAGAAGAGQAGSTGMLAAGSGSEAISGMATNFMESVNGLGLGNLYNPETIATAKAGTSGGDIAGTSAASDTGGRTLGLTSEAAAPIASDSSTTIGLAGSEGPMTDASMDTMNLADAGMDSNMRAVAGGAQGGMATPSAVTGGLSGGATAPATEKGFFSKALGFVKENPELTKIGSGMLSQAMASGEEDEQVSALIKQYEANTDLLKTRNDVEKYKLANAGKQVAMISADDPDLDAKVKAATAAGTPVAFIPAVGKDYTPVSKNFTPVVRNATYNQPTATAQR